MIFPSIVVSSLLLASSTSATPLRTRATEANSTKVLASPAFYSAANYFAHFASAAYSVPCPSPPYGVSIVDYINIDLTSTQATVFRDDARKQIILAFPGTASVTDQALDLLVLLVPPVAAGFTIQNCPFCLVHPGVLLAYDSAASTIQNVLNKQIKLYPDYELTITGHSLGASIASLAYASLSGLKYKIAAAYTFGQPRVGDISYANHINSLAGIKADDPGTYYRSTHAKDGVPQTPPQLLGYYHSSTEYFELDDAEDEESASTTYRCFGGEDPDCSASEGNPFAIGPGHGYYAGVYMGTGEVCGTSRPPYSPL